jgi:hypothetical protein
MKSLAVAVLAGLAAAPSFAQFTPITSPVAPYTTTTTLIPITQPNTTVLTSLSGSGTTVTLSTQFRVQEVLPGGNRAGGWINWSSPPDAETSTPKLLARYADPGTVTLTLSPAPTTFGFELQPNFNVDANAVVVFKNGATTLGTVTRTINGFLVSRLFAASSSTPITSVEVTLPPNAGGWAMAQLRFAPIITPVPTMTTATLVMLTASLALAGVVFLRKRGQRA